MKLTNPVTGKSFSIQYCASFWCRLRGLTFRRSIPPNWGLLLVQARASRLESSIHMLFVFTDLAVIWLDDDFRVVDRTLARTWRPYYAPAHPARYVLELHPEHITDFTVGEQWQLHEDS